MALSAAPSARPDFLKNCSKFRCDFCSNPDVKPARVVNKNVGSFIESKATFECYELITGALTNYITTEVMASPQLIRYFLGNIHTIRNLRKQGLVKEFLIHHLQMHPPCRPGMSEYYCSLLNQTLDSLTFKQEAISDKFLDFVKRLKEAISSRGARAVPKEEAPSSSSAVGCSRKEILASVKQKFESLKQPKSETVDPQMDLLMFVFDYCVDILIHDYRSTRDTPATPLVVKIIWGSAFESESEKSLTPDCQDAIWMYFKCQPLHRLPIARYLILLAEVMQKDVCPDSHVYELSSNELVDAFVQKFVEFELPADLIENIPSPKLRCQISQSLIYENILSGADYPKKISLSRSNSRSKKCFPIFKKKFNP